MRDTVITIERIICVAVDSQAPLRGTCLVVSDEQPDEKQPDQTLEGSLIANALVRHVPKMSQREAARRSELSETRWRQIVQGYQQLADGVRAPVVAPPDTLARMAHAVGVSAEALREAGRDDAARALETLAPKPHGFAPAEQDAFSRRVYRAYRATPATASEDPLEVLEAQLRRQREHVSMSAMELEASRANLHAMRERLEDASREEARNAAVHERDIALLHELEIEYAVAMDRLRRERSS